MCGRQAHLLWDMLRRLVPQPASDRRDAVAMHSPMLQGFAWPSVQTTGWHCYFGQCLPRTRRCGMRANGGESRAGSTSCAMPAWLTVGMYGRSDHCTSTLQPCAAANAFATSAT